MIDAPQRCTMQQLRNATAAQCSIVPSGARPIARHTGRFPSRKAARLALLNPPFTHKTHLCRLAIAVILITGCGSSESPSRKAVQGRITIDGAPAPAGSISFLPARGTSGPAATSLIVDAEYRFTQSNGPYTGAHKVVISLDSPAAVASTQSRPTRAEAPEATADTVTVDPKRRTSAKSPSARQKRESASATGGKRTWELEFVVPQTDQSVKNFALSTLD